MRARLRQFFHRIAAVEASFPKLLIVPRVFKNSDSGHRSVERQRKLFGGRLKIARFVENIVAWKQHLVLAKRNASALQYGGAVVNRVSGGRAGACDGSADDCEIQVRGVGCKTGQMLLGAMQGNWLLQHIARLISNTRPAG